MLHYEGGLDALVLNYEEFFISLDIAVSEILEDTFLPLDCKLSTVALLRAVTSVFASLADLLLVVLDEILDSIGIHTHWLGGVKLFGLDSFIIKGHIFIYTYQVTIQSVMYLSELSLFLSRYLSPLINFQFQIIYGFLCLEH